MCFVCPIRRSTQLLDSLLENIGLRREDVYIANVLKYRPPKNRNPQPDEIEICKPYLYRQLKLVHESEVPADDRGFMWTGETEEIPVMTRQQLATPKAVCQGINNPLNSFGRSPRSALWLEASDQWPLRYNNLAMVSAKPARRSQDPPAIWFESIRPYVIQSVALVCSSVSLLENVPCQPESPPSQCDTYRRRHILQPSSTSRGVIPYRQILLSHPQG